jgi:hypothetical protein
VAAREEQQVAEEPQAEGEWKAAEEARPVGAPAEARPAEAPAEALAKRKKKTRGERLLARIERERIAAAAAEGSAPAVAEAAAKPPEAPAVPVATKPKRKRRSAWDRWHARDMAAREAAAREAASAQPPPPAAE